MVYLPEGGTSKLDLSGATGEFMVKWFNPRVGGMPIDGPVRTVKAERLVELGQPPSDAHEDWLVIVRK